MITRELLNEDQQKSFLQMTLEAGLSEERALEFIEEFCIQKKMTGLRVQAFALTPEGERVAWELWMERLMGEGLRDSFKKATEGMGILTRILFGICVGLCVPIGFIYKILKLGR